MASYICLMNNVYYPITAPDANVAYRMMLSSVMKERSMTVEQAVRELSRTSLITAVSGEPVTTEPYVGEIPDEQEVMEMLQRANPDFDELTTSRDMLEMHS